MVITIGWALVNKGNGVIPSDSSNVDCFHIYPTRAAARKQCLTYAEKVVKVRITLAI
jgi:hypothetical protein